MRRAARGIKKAATLARRLGHDTEWMRKARDIAAENNRQMYETSGRAAGYNWRDRDYVETGQLRKELTSPRLLKSRVGARYVAFNARVKYRKYWVWHILAWTQKPVVELGKETTKSLKRVVEREWKPLQ